MRGRPFAKGFGRPPGLGFKTVTAANIIKLPDLLGRKDDCA